MGIKLTEWRLKMTENVGSVLSKLNSAADKVGGRLYGVQNQLNSGKFASFSNEIPQANRALELLSNRYVMAGAGAAALGTIMFKGGQEALSYEEAMAKVNATAQMTPGELEKLKNQLVDIGENSAGNFSRIPDAFEKINSRINNVSRSLEILKVANQGAKAGFVDIDMAAGALASTLSIVGDKDNAGGIMDLLLKSKAVGAGEFADFANYLPALISGGSPLGIQHKDVAGLYSYLTTKYSNASDAAMYLQNAFTAMGKSDIQKGLSKSGLNLFDKEGNIRDLGVFFSELQKKLNKFSPEGKSNWLESTGLTDVQARKAFTVLASDAQKLLDVMTQVRDSNGELNRQLDFTENKTRSWSEIGDKIKSGMVGIGDALLPIVDKIFKGGEAWLAVMNGAHPTQNVWKLNEDERLARNYAEEKVKEKFPMYGPAMFENKGAKLTGPAKELYDYSYNWDIAKLTGTMFGGDYDKWRKDKEAMLEKKPGGEEKKEGFKFDKKHKNVKEGIDSVSQGGHRIVNVNFGKLNENIIVQPQTLKEGTNEVVNNLEEMLVRVLTGAEESIANQ